MHENGYFYVLMIFLIIQVSTSFWKLIMSCSFVIQQQHASQIMCFYLPQSILFVM